MSFLRCNSKALKRKRWQRPWKRKLGEALKMTRITKAKIRARLEIILGNKW